MVPAGKEDNIVVLAATGGKPQTIRGSSSLQLELCASPEVRCHEEKELWKQWRPNSRWTVKCFLLKTQRSPWWRSRWHQKPKWSWSWRLKANRQAPTASCPLRRRLSIAVATAPATSTSSWNAFPVLRNRCPANLCSSAQKWGDKTLLASEESELESQHVYYKQKEEVVIAWNGEDQQQEEESVSSSSPSDENIPPVRRRTYSESLRLHSLAAEVLVAMPMRAPELSKTAAKGMHDPSTQSPDRPEIIEITDTANPKASSEVLMASIGDQGALLNLGLQSSKDSRDVLVEGPSKAGISMSLLTVIERLQERSDQNTSDEDILKELQDNAQSQHGGGVSGDAAVPGDISTTDGLVEYIAGSEKPYRCRLCLYSSGNKGYMKQHLRVHRQRQPYQCPICEHIAVTAKTWSITWSTTSSLAFTTANSAPKGSTTRWGEKQVEISIKKVIYYNVFLLGRKSIKLIMSVIKTF